ncbi:hypothetical protein PoB_006930000 [Plakobranchus ocellatus]|uniref:Uncharacterized protein n=1 Tax=Plakobranchus ocellatus TaxID=259542 RepID=A0AAV4DFL0_9GAST|nr:hypothetical protein PoB_006930000 [Plakobranchus ocellatus]
MEDQSLSSTKMAVLLVTTPVQDLRDRVETNIRGVGGTVAIESALRIAGTLLLRVGAPPPAPWRDEGPEITLLWTGYTQKPNFCRPTL